MEINQVENNNLNEIKNYLKEVNAIINNFNITFNEKSLDSLYENFENLIKYRNYLYIIEDNEYYSEDLDNLYNSISTFNTNLQNFGYIFDKKFCNTFLLNILETISYILLTNFKNNQTITNIIKNNVNTHSSILISVMNQNLIKIPYAVLHKYIIHVNNFLTIDENYLPKEKKYNTAKFVLNEIISYCLVVFNPDSYIHDLEEYIINRYRENNNSFTEDLQNDVSNYVNVVLIFKDLCIDKFGSEILNEISKNIIDNFEEKRS